MNATAVRNDNGTSTQARRIPIRRLSTITKTLAAVASTTRSHCRDWVAAPLLNHSPNQALPWAIARPLKIQVIAMPTIERPKYTRASGVQPRVRDMSTV